MVEEIKLLEEQREMVPESSIDSVLAARARRNDFYIELALFLILGILVGIAAKTEAVKKITIGFEDYKIASDAQYYNINTLGKELKAKRAADLEEINSQEAQQEGSQTQSDESEIGQDQTTNENSNNLENTNSQ